MKTITIEDKTWQKLARLRTNLLARSYTEVIERILGIITKFKLAQELKENSK